MFALEETAQSFGAFGRFRFYLDFDFRLDRGELGFKAQAAQRAKTTFGFFPGGFAAAGFKGDLEQEPAISIFERRAQSHGIRPLVRGAGDKDRFDQGFEDAFGFKAAMQIFRANGFGELAAETFGLEQKLDEAAFDGFADVYKRQGRICV